MKRRLRIFWAHVRCNSWLFLRPLSGACAFTGYDDKKRTIFIAATKGSISNGTLRIRRIFYNENPCPPTTSPQ